MQIMRYGVTPAECSGARRGAIHSCLVTKILQLCDTYPRRLFVPAAVSDEVLAEVCSAAVATQSITLHNDIFPRWILCAVRRVPEQAATACAQLRVRPDPGMFLLHC
jgi:hypothetical protein